MKLKTRVCSDWTRGKQPFAWKPLTRRLQVHRSTTRPRLIGVGVRCLLAFSLYEGAESLTVVDLLGKFNDMPTPNISCFTSRHFGLLSVTPYQRPRTFLDYQEAQPPIWPNSVHPLGSCELQHFNNNEQRIPKIHGGKMKQAIFSVLV
jgi:hypothetical protein